MWSRFFAFYSGYPYVVVEPWYNDSCEDGKIFPLFLMGVATAISWLTLLILCTKDSLFV